LTKIINPGLNLIPNFVFSFINVKYLKNLLPFSIQLDNGVVHLTDGAHREERFEGHHVLFPRVGGDGLVGPALQQPGNKLWK
jgi:hypothetical protein